MSKIFFLIVLSFISHLSFSQLADNNSSKEDTSDILNAYDKVFTKAEKMPKFIGGINALEDTLTKRLVKYNEDLKKGKVSYELRITNTGMVSDMTAFNESGNLSFANQLAEVLKNTSHMWEPAMQNGRLVDALKKIRIIFDKEKLHVKELN